MRAVRLKSNKGIVGEDIPAILMTIILLFGFIASVIHSYGNHFRSIDHIEAERVAVSFAGKLYMDSEGVISNGSKSMESVAERAKEFKNVAINITNLETGKTIKRGSVNGSTIAVGSVAILIEDGGKYYPGRIDVYVGK